MNIKKLKLSDELKKKREKVFHEKKGDCNSSCYDGCDACLLNHLIGQAEYLESNRITTKLKDGNVWKMAAQRLARAIIHFQQDDFKLNHTESTVRFAYRVRKGNI